jgi:hypothetical protein
MASHSEGEEQRAHLRVLQDLLRDVLAPLTDDDRARFLKRPIYAVTEAKPNGS